MFCLPGCVPRRHKDGALAADTLLSRAKWSHLFDHASRRVGDEVGALDFLREFVMMETSGAVANESLRRTKTVSP